MTRALSNDDFADRMRERRGLAPQERYTVLAWIADDILPAWWASEITVSNALMTPCTKAGTPIDDHRRARVPIGDVAGLVRLRENPRGPEIWRVTFRVGRTPEGW